MSGMEVSPAVPEVATPLTEEIDLGRAASILLTEVRTVLSRAENALGTGEWIGYTSLVLQEEKYHWERDEDGNHVRVIDQQLVKIPHPERDEIRAALEQVIELLSPWRRTGRPKKK